MNTFRKSCLGLVLCCLALTSGCTYTRMAFKEAKGDPVKIAYVTSELYYIQLVEANRVKNSGASEQVVSLLQQGEEKATPLVVKMAEVGQVFKEVGTAKSKEELEEATAAAANAVADFVDLIKRVK